MTERMIKESRARAEELNRIQVTTVEGHKYEYWSDEIIRGTMAQDENGEIRRVYGSGYIHKDLTVRKAIANKFGHKTFRK